MNALDTTRAHQPPHSTNPPARQKAPPALTPAQALGNQAMQALQPKLEVNAPNDPYEQEADRFASQVTDSKAPAPAQRASAAPEPEKKDGQTAQMKPLAAQATPLVQRKSSGADEKKKDEPKKAAQKAPLQRETAGSEKKKDDKKAAPAQRAPAGDEKKKDEPKKAAQKAPLQREAAGSDKKKDDKKAAPAQRAPAGDENKKDDKKAAQKAPLQREAAAPEKKKDDKKAAQKAPLQREAAGSDKKKDDKKAAPAQRAPAGDEKKKEEPKKAAQKAPLQRASTAPSSDEEDMKAQTKRASPPQLDDEKVKKGEDGDSAQRQAVQRDSSTASLADPAVEADIERLKSNGRPLDPADRQYFEQRFGADFSQVRIQDNPEAASAARKLNARAFTQGRYIFFGAGAYQPRDTPGRRLLAHELTHTLQQGAARPAHPTPHRAAPPSAHETTRPVPPTHSDAVPPAPAEHTPTRPAPPAPARGAHSRGTTPPAPPASPPAHAHTVPPAPAEHAPATGHSAGSTQPAPPVPSFVSSPPPAPVPASPSGVDAIPLPALTAPPIPAAGPAAPAGAPAAQRTAALANPSTAPAGLVQRAPTPPPAAGGGPGGAPTPGPDTDATQFTPEKGKLENETITFDKIKIPAFKNFGHRRTLYNAQHPLRRTKNFARANNQRDIWRTNLKIDTIKTILQGKAQPPDPQASRFVFEIEVAGRPKLYFFGSLDDIARELTLPIWTGTTHPEYRALQVDHVVELQLANWNANTTANELNNMELLRDTHNASSGSSINANINDRLTRFATDTGGRYGTSPGSLRANYNIDFQQIDETSGAADIPATDYWTRAQIEAGQHLSAVRQSNLASLGGSGKVMVFGKLTGGLPKGFKWPGGLDSDEKKWLKPFEIKTKNFVTEGANVENDPNFGQFTLGVSPNDPKWEQAGSDRPVPITRAPGARFAGAIDKQAVKSGLGSLRIKKSSPIEVTTFDIGPGGIEAAGVLTSDLPIFRGATIDFLVEGGELTLSKTFSTTEFTLPPPIHVTNSELTIAISTRTGLGISGRMDFEITNLGRGYLQAGAGTATSIFLEGHFDFDTRLFNPASITMRYREGQFSGEGHLGIPNGKLRGIRSAQIDVSYAAGVFTANGMVQPSIPGVQQGTLSVVYSEQDGLVISGALQLAENPAIRSGSIDARVQRNPDGSYKVQASGKAQPKIPGVDSELNVTYDDGAFDMEVTASFSRGMLHGSLQAAATNRPVNPDTGQPGGEPTERITVYGGGSVTVRFSPWLEGTAGIRLLPNGEIEISGSIGLPSSVTIFDAKRFDRNIFHLNIDIPIVGLSVAGQRVGIFATIGGGLDLRAGIGPGELRDLNLGVTYNPSHEDQTHITGHGEFVIPADAGLRLSVHGGIGVGIPIVSAEAGIELSGELGLQGAARAAVDVDWTPQRGIVLDALGEIFVEPRLKLDVSAYVKVTADLVLTSIDLYDHRWRLAGTEIGSNLRFGVRFPIHYEQGQPFTLSTDALEFVIPQIDPQSILSGIFA